MSKFSWPLEIDAGPKLYILQGIRYEYTSEDFVGRNVRFAPNRAPPAFSTST